MLPLAGSAGPGKRDGASLSVLRSALPLHPGDREIAASRDGRVVAQSMWAGYGMDPFAGGWILHPNAPAPRWVNAGKTTGWCSVSPDGRWVAFGDDFH